MITRDKMSKPEYTSEGGIRCPHCRSLNIYAVGKLREAEDGRIYKAMRCLDCGGRWREIWVLKGYEA